MNFDGTWDITLRSPQGDQAARLQLLSGDAPQGTLSTDDGTTDLKDLAISEGTATWKVLIAKPMPLVLDFTGTVDGDSISGIAKVSTFAKIPFDGTRV